MDSICAEALPTYTVFAEPQMLPAPLQEKLNRAERSASANVNGTNRHGGWHGRVETNGIAGHKTGRGVNRGQPSRHRRRPKSGERHPSRPTAGQIGRAHV